MQDNHRGHRPFLLLLLAIGACGDLPVGGDPHRNDFITATINGRSWVSGPGQTLSQRIGKSLIISAISASDSSELVLGIDSVHGVGSYPIDSVAGNHAEFITASSFYQTRRLPGSGTITITRYEADALAATFSFTATATSQSADTERVVTAINGRVEIGE